MSWFTRIFGAPKPKRSVSQMNAIRGAIGADGDETGMLEPLLKPPVDLNAHEGDPVVPILLAGDGMMITNHGTFPLILAAMLHKPDRARLLLERGARVNVTCAHDRTPLHWAILGEPDSSLLNFYEVASKDAAAKHEPQPPLGEIGSVNQAASLATTRLLLEHGADPNVRDALGQTPFFRACSVGGKTEHLKLLLQRGADVNAGTHVEATPLMMAAQRGLEETVAVLLDAGADPNRADLRGSTALHWACARASLPIARLLLAARADPSARDQDGLTPLSIAAELQQAELMQALRDAGAADMPPSGQDRADTPMNTPPDPPQPHALLLATAHGSLRAVQHLLQLGQVALEARTGDGWTALHEAVAHGPEMTGLLLAAGANANASSEAGYTPLHRAAAKGQAEVVKLLVEHGADVSATDVHGNTLERFAQTSGDPQTIACVAELCRNAVRPQSAAETADRFMDYLTRNIVRSPERIQRARAAGQQLISGGDGSSAEHAVVVHAPDIGWGVTFLYEYLDEKFGPRRTKQADAAGVPFETGWRLVEANSIASGQRHLNCMTFALPGGRQGAMYFDVTEWSRLDSVIQLLTAHSVINRPEGSPSAMPEVRG